MLSERGTMLRMIAVIGLAGLTSLTVWSQSTGNTPERSPNSANQQKEARRTSTSLIFCCENSKTIGSSTAGLTR